MGVLRGLRGALGVLRTVGVVGSAAYSTAKQHREHGADLSHSVSPGADVGQSVSPGTDVGQSVPAPMWATQSVPAQTSASLTQSRRRCGPISPGADVGHSLSPGADVAAGESVLAQMWAGKSRRRCEPARHSSQYYRVLRVLTCYRTDGKPSVKYYRVRRVRTLHVLALVVR